MPPQGGIEIMNGGNKRLLRAQRKKRKQAYNCVLYQAINANKNIPRTKPRHQKEHIMAEPEKAEAANAAPQEEQPAAQSEKPAAKTAPAAKAKAAGKPKEQVIKLYEAGKRIHPKKAEGRFAKLRIAAILATQFVFYCIPWFNWSGRQAVLFDIPNRHFFIFGLSFGMADLIYLALLLIISAFGLFWWTTVAGRLWCGYACPQTVYTEIMLWIDHFVEGDRNKRMKLDKEPWNLRKIRIKFTKYLIIFAVCAWTGITFAGWFTPIREFVPAVFTMQAGGTALFAAAFYGFVTWLFAHQMREQVCKHMCPYARFQSAMFDPDTLIISYDTERGEPRGARKKTVARGETDLGDCINCTMCVQVCPVGIDIRDGLQYECIGCAACIDACDEVMDKMGYPRGLIRYSTENGVANGWSRQQLLRRVLRPRVLVYTAILAAVTIALLASIALRTPFKVDIVRDRAALARIVAGGRIENIYRVQIMNAAEAAHTFTLQAQGLPGLEVAAGRTVEVPAAQAKWVSVRLQTPYDAAAPGAHPVTLRISAPQLGEVTEKTIFMLPR